MFIGSVPREVVTQLSRVSGIDNDSRVYVCCSGSFRIDLTFKSLYPDIWLSGNDVSLLSCALGHHLAGQALAFKFINDLAFVEGHLAGRPYLMRLAALSVALEMLKFNPKTVYGRTHIDYYHNHFPEILQTADKKHQDKFAASRIDDFFAGDFQEQALRAKQTHGIVLAFPPTYKGGYERMYKKLDSSTEWNPPSFATWNPADMPDWLASLRSARIRHCVFVDYPIEGLQPMAKFIKPRAHPILLYGWGGQKSSYRLKQPKSTPFRYTPVDPSSIDQRTVVSVIPISNGPFNFLRNKYLARNIDFCDGMYNHLVLLDGCVAGGFCLNLSRHGGLDDLYLLSDFSIRRERRLAKLIAMLASSREAIEPIQKRMLMRYADITTTVFTDRPISMKYRGIYELRVRKPGFLTYGTAIREQSNQEIYLEWFKRYAKDPGCAQKAA